MTWQDRDDFGEVPLVVVSLVVLALLGVKSAGVALGDAGGTNGGSRRQPPSQAGTGPQGRFTQKTSIKWVDDGGSESGSNITMVHFRMQKVRVNSNFRITVRSGC